MILDERVRADLARNTRFGDIRLLEETDSTNRVVLDLAGEGAPEGLVVASDRQTAGRGRLDRTWEADPGAGLLVSVLLRPGDLPADRWYLLTACAGLAAQSACLATAGVEPGLKWPNDLLVDGAKLAGILAEARTGAVVVGMGLNVHAGPPGSAWLDSAAGRRISRADLLVEWLTGFDALLGLGWDQVVDRYRRRCATVGQDVVIEQAGGSRLAGTAIDVDDHGRLVVRVGGKDVAVAVGDVTHVRPA